MPKDINEEIKSIVKQLVEKYKPQKIILFGSAQADIFDRDRSDLDFLVIKKNPPREGRKRIYELDKLIDYRIATDFIVYTPNELKSLINLRDPFVLSIIKEGKTLYG